MPTYEEYKAEMGKQLAAFKLNSGTKGTSEFSFDFLMLRKVSQNYPKKYLDDFLKSYLTPANKKLMEMVDGGMLVPISDAKNDTFGNPKINQYVLNTKGNEYVIDSLIKNANNDYLIGSDYSTKLKHSIIGYVDKLYQDAGYGHEFGLFGSREMANIDGNTIEKKAVNMIDGSVQVEKANALIAKTGVQLSKKDKENLLNEGMNTLSRLATAHKSHGLLFKIFRYFSYKKEANTLDNLKNSLVTNCGIKKETLDLFQESCEDYIDVLKNGRSVEIQIGVERNKNVASATNIDHFKDELTSQFKASNTLDMSKVFDKVIGYTPNSIEYKETLATLQALQEKVPVAMDEKFFNNIIEDYYHAKADDKTNLMMDIAKKIIKDYDPEGKYKLAKDDDDLEFDNDSEIDDDEVIDDDDLDKSMLFKEGEIPDESIKSFINRYYGNDIEFSNDQANEIKTEPKARDEIEIENKELEGEIDYNNDFSNEMNNSKDSIDMEI